MAAVLSLASLQTLVVDAAACAPEGLSKQSNSGNANPIVVAAGIIADVSIPPPPPPPRKLANALRSLMHSRFAWPLPAPPAYNVVRGVHSRAHVNTSTDQAATSVQSPEWDDVPLLQAVHERGARQHQVCAFSSRGYVIDGPHLWRHLP